MSKIEWTGVTWNPVAGCSILSPGCTNCYAMRMAARCELMGQRKYDGTTRKTGGRAKWTGKIVCDEASLAIPVQWKSPKTVFVNSMSDLLHDRVSLTYIGKVLDVMRATPQHSYQVLTKRPERLAEIDASIGWPANLWMGVSVESDDYLWRTDLLRQCSAKIKFLSLEPLLGPLRRLDLTGIDWVIVGGESGPGARPMRYAWAQDVRDMCFAAGVPFFFKQWGQHGNNPALVGLSRDAARRADPYGKGGGLLDGQLYREFPVLEA